MQSTNFAMAQPPYGPAGFGDKRAPQFAMPTNPMGQPFNFANPNFQGMPPMFPGMGSMLGMPGMGGMPGAGALPMGIFPQGFNRRNLVKEFEFAKGIYVFDFEESMTGEMLFKHFNAIKPVAVIKFPTTKERFSKTFAFVYFKTQEDAREVKEVIEKDREEEERAIAEKKPAAEIEKLKRRHRIMKRAIRVSPLAANEVSKLMLKPKYDRQAPDAKVVLKKLNEEYFNAINLEREIKRIIANSPSPTNTEFRFNKVIVPVDPKDETIIYPYARAYFDLHNRGQIDNIKELLESDETFKKYVDVLPFKQLIPSSSNMLYIKGFIKKGDSQAGLNDELQATFQKLNPAWKINSVFTKESDFGTWGYICFSTPEECKQANEMLRPLKTTFRGNVIFANIKNQIDNRAVIIYELKDSVTLDEVTSFFKTISQNSKRVEVESEESKKEGEPEAEISQDKPAERRRFDFYDINILEPRTIEKKHGPSVEIARRIVITFLDGIDGTKLNELIVETTQNPRYRDIFNPDRFKARCLKPYKLTGHINKNSEYVIHKQMNNYDGKGKKRSNNDSRPFNKNPGMKKPTKVGPTYNPIMNIPSIPNGKYNNAGKMPYPGAGSMKNAGAPRPPMPYAMQMAPGGMAPSGMGSQSGINAMASKAGKPPGPGSIGSIGMNMPGNINPMAQMSIAGAMRPNAMGGNAMGNAMGGIMPAGMNAMGYGPMGGMNAMGNKPFPPMGQMGQVRPPTTQSQEPSQQQQESKKE